MMKWSLLSLVVAVGCDSGGGGGGTDAGGDAGEGPGDAAARPDLAFEFPDAGPPISLQSVPGDLMYASLDGEDGHLFSVLADGTARRQITSEPGRWTYASVGPNPRYVATVRLEGEDGPGEVVIVDVKERNAWAISPDGCDAGIGGVGWRDRARVMFAMRCGDEPSQAYLSLFDNRAREIADMEVLTAEQASVRDVFPVVNRPLYTYVVDREVCNDGCVIKPQVWVAEHETALACQLTDGDLGFTDVSTLTEGGRRLGDHQPTFNSDLTAILFSRNVGGKPGGPEGHHDLMRIGFDVQALFRGRPTCAVSDTLTNVTDTGLDERYPDAEGREVEGDERFPQAASGRGPPGTLLYTAQTHAGSGTSAVWAVDVSGARVALTEPTGRAGFARWVVLDYDLDGER